MLVTMPNLSGPKNLQLFLSFADNVFIGLSSTKLDCSLLTKNLKNNQEKYFVHHYTTIVKKSQKIADIFYVKMYIPNNFRLIFTLLIPMFYWASAFYFPQKDSNRSNFPCKILCDTLFVLT